MCLRKDYFLKIRLPDKLRLNRLLVDAAIKIESTCLLRDPIVGFVDGSHSETARLVLRHLYLLLLQWCL